MNVGEEGNSIYKLCEGMSGSGCQIKEGYVIESNDYYSTNSCDIDLMLVMLLMFWTFENSSAYTCSTINIKAHQNFAIVCGHW